MKHRTAALVGVAETVACLLAPFVRPGIQYLWYLAPVPALLACHSAWKWRTTR